MPALGAYIGCCSAQIAYGFGQNFDHRGEISVKEIKETITASIESLRKQLHHTVITALIIRKQTNAKQALEELGFKQASGWMVKPTLNEEATARHIKAQEKSFANTRARYIKAAEEYKKSGNQGYYEYYMREADSFSEERFEKWKEGYLADQEELNKVNEERATMLFYLPLNGEET